VSCGSRDSVATCEVFGLHTRSFLLFSNPSSDELGEAGSVWKRVNPFGASCNTSRSLYEVRALIREDADG